ncbi:MAG: hypothetical protein E7013_02340 [Alphaproteobacteria bacterium]|nr:hypothetical protein [Alphaproteobacteria bacterium]
MMITVHDKMQQNYAYLLTEEEGKNFAPDFKPQLTPKEMLELGVFEGKYLTDCTDEFPKDWFEKAKLSPQKPNIECNYFKVKSRQSLNTWIKKGWILEPDPRGWFQWYCRYYMGRRLPEIDKIQIKRWKSFIRHKAQIELNCPPFDVNCRKKQRQALLQWAYNPFI